MTLKILCLWAAVLLLAGGCATQMESANRGANEAGQTVGGAMRLPNSVSEGAAKATANDTDPNPYGR